MELKVQLETNLEKDFNIIDLLKTMGRISKKGVAFSIQKVLEDIYAPHYTVIEGSCSNSLGGFNNAVIDCSTCLEHLFAKTDLVQNINYYRMATYYVDVFSMGVSKFKSNVQEYLISSNKGKLSYIGGSKLPFTINFNLLDNLFIVKVFENNKSIYFSQIEDLNRLDISKLEDLNVSNEAISFLFKNYCYINNIEEVLEGDLNVIKTLSELNGTLKTSNQEETGINKIFESENEIIYLKTATHRTDHPEHGVKISFKDCLLVERKDNLIKKNKFDLNEILTKDIRKNFDFSFSEKNLFN